MIGEVRRLTRTARALLLAVVTAITLSGCDFDVYSLPLPGGADLGDDSYAVTVQFRDVLDLVPQSAVKVDDVTVGKVEEISVDGYTALVDLRLRGDVVLPANATAGIRMTSLLGEKYVALSPPVDEPATGRLEDGDTIPLSRSSRNPEVEEVLGALSLLLNGGGVAQLKIITQELNDAMEGNEAEIRSVLGQLDIFMGQLDKNKEDIVAAIRAINALAISVKEQNRTIVTTLDQMPESLRVLDQQRSGLVKMLRGLQRLEPVATRVIRASKQTTVANLRALDPILTQLANAGDALPNAFQVFLTYPFVDATVGRSPAEARNLHQGDYTNLSAQLDIDLENLPAPLPTLPELPTVTVPTVPLPTLPTVSVPSEVCELGGLPCDKVNDCLQNPDLDRCDDVVRDVCRQYPGSDLCADLTDRVCEAGSVLGLCDPDETIAPTSGVTTSTVPGDPVCTLAPILCRPAVRYPDRRTAAGYDEDLALLLLQGVEKR
jgi:phospholipid/cholesterol/gamma-HCH transport system substrate-binding protein